MSKSERKRVMEESREYVHIHTCIYYYNHNNLHIRIHTCFESQARGYNILFLKPTR